MKLLLLAAALALAAPPHAYCASAEPRIRVVHYDPKSVIHLDGCLGYQTMIEFGPDERIENVGIGDSTKWLAVPNARANLLFIRPAVALTRSNMTVATAHRRYVFDLSAAPTPACAQGEVVYYLRFRYDDLPRPARSWPKKPEPTRRNAAYSYSGSKENLPLTEFDDGKATFFRWADGAATPAVFVKSGKSERLTNFMSRGDYLVANEIARCFVLRNGAAVTTLFNEGFGAPATAAATSGLRRHKGAARC